MVHANPHCRFAHIRVILYLNASNVVCFACFSLYLLLDVYVHCETQSFFVTLFMHILSSVLFFLSPFVSAEG